MIENIATIGGWIVAAFWMFLSAVAALQIMSLFTVDEKDERQILTAFVLFLCFFAFLVYLPSVCKRVYTYVNSWYVNYMEAYYDSKMGKFDVNVIRRIKTNIESRDSQTSSNSPHNLVSFLTLPRSASNAVYSTIRNHISEPFAIDADVNGAVNYAFDHKGGFVTCRFLHNSKEVFIRIFVKVEGMILRIVFEEPISMGFVVEILNELISNHTEPPTNAD